MTLLKSIITVAALAQGLRALTITGNECPNGWSMNTLGNNDKIFCCYGSSTINGDSGYCCVTDHGNGVIGDDSDGIGGSPDDDCFPFCHSTTAMDKRAFPSQSCVEKVPFTASDYSERVSAASKSVAAKATQTSGTKPNAASASATGLSTEESANSASTAAASTMSKSTNAGAMITGDAIPLAGVVAAAAFFGL